MVNPLQNWTGLLLFQLILTFKCVEYSGIEYKKYKYPPWAEGVGWILSAVLLAFIPLWMVINLCRCVGSWSVSLVFNLALYQNKLDICNILLNVFISIALRWCMWIFLESMVGHSWTSFNKNSKPAQPCRAGCKMEACDGADKKSRNKRHWWKSGEWCRICRSISRRSMLCYWQPNLFKSCWGISHMITPSYFWICTIPLI